jgi:hypothetical protein
MGQTLPYADERFTALVMSKRSLQCKTVGYPLCALGLCGYIVAIQSALQMLGHTPRSIAELFASAFS